MVLGARRCYKCGATDEIRGAVVLEATDEEIVGKSLPVGVSLCSECAFMTDEERERADRLLGWEEQLEIAERKVLIAEEEKEDKALDEREWAMWSNKFGGW